MPKPTAVNARPIFFEDQGNKRFAKYAILCEKGWIAIEHSESLGTSFTAGLGDTEGAIFVPNAHMPWHLYLEVRRLIAYAQQQADGRTRKAPFYTSVRTLLVLLGNAGYAKATEFNAVLQKLLFHYQIKPGDKP